MNIVLAGYRQWAFRIFQSLVKAQKGKSWKVSGILTTSDPEAPFSRLHSKTLAYPPKDLSSAGAVAALAKLKPKCILFYGWSWIVSKPVLDLAPAICLHPSPLPKYRGGSPIQNQILAGEVWSAVSLFFMTEKLDDGNLLAQSKFSLAGELSEIFDRIVSVGARLTVQTLDRMALGTLKAWPQDSSQATVCVRRKPGDSEITLSEIQSKPARYLYDKIRALQPPYPPAFIRAADGRKLILQRASLEP